MSQAIGTSETIEASEVASARTDVLSPAAPAQLGESTAVLAAGAGGAADTAVTETLAAAGPAVPQHTPAQAPALAPTEGAMPASQGSGAPAVQGAPVLAESDPAARNTVPAGSIVGNNKPMAPEFVGGGDKKTRNNLPWYRRTAAKITAGTLALLISFGAGWGFHDILQVTREAVSGTANTSNGQNMPGGGMQPPSDMGQRGGRGGMGGQGSSDSGDSSSGVLQNNGESSSSGSGSSSSDSSKGSTSDSSATGLSDSSSTSAA